MHEDTNKIDITGYDMEHTVVRCSTQEEANEFLEYLYRKGVWNRESMISVRNNWSYYADKTCYHISKNEWCYDSWFEEEYGYIVVDFCDLTTHTNLEEITFSFDEMMGLNTLSEKRETICS